MFLLKKILAALFLPPAGPVLLALFGLWLARSAKSRHWQHGGAALATLSLVSLLLLSLPVVGNALMVPLEPNPPITTGQLQRVQAIVILGGGTYYVAPEYGGDTVNHYTLERLRYGARLARESRLPLLVTGGAPFSGRPEGEAMREGLEVTPAPTAFSTGSPSVLENLLPGAMNRSRIALNEYLGQLYNRLKETK